MPKVSKKAFRSEGPLSEDELKVYRTRLGLTLMLSGRDAFNFEQRVLAEMLFYRSLKKVFITMDEHHSSTGTSPVLRYQFGPDDDQVQIIGVFPIGQLGFSLERGRRYLLLAHELPRDKKMKPRKNPFLRKAKTFLLNEKHTTHITKAQLRKERKAKT